MELLYHLFELLCGTREENQRFRASLASQPSCAALSSAGEWLQRTRKAPEGDAAGQPHTQHRTRSTRTRPSASGPSRQRKQADALVATRRLGWRQPRLGHHRHPHPRRICGGGREPSAGEGERLRTDDRVRLSEQTQGLRCAKRLVSLHTPPVSRRSSTAHRRIGVLVILPETIEGLVHEAGWPIERVMLVFLSSIVGMFVLDHCFFEHEHLPASGSAAAATVTATAATAAAAATAETSSNGVGAAAWPAASAAEEGRAGSAALSHAPAGCEPCEPCEPCDAPEEEEE
eukprot:6983319-Prymnesium_polylepis.1